MVMRRSFRAEIFNLPNVVTLGRLAVVPALCILLWPSVESRTTCFIAAVLYGIAGALDVVDGAIARRTGQVTDLGKFLDPLADKVVSLTALFLLTALPGGRFPMAWALIILIRELMVTGLRTMATAEGWALPAGRGGKLKTSLGVAGSVALIAHYPCWMNFGFFEALIRVDRIGMVLSGASLFFSLSSAWTYSRAFWHHSRAEGRTA